MQEINHFLTLQVLIYEKNKENRQGRGFSVPLIVQPPLGIVILSLVKNQHQRGEECQKEKSRHSMWNRSVDNSQLCLLIVICLGGLVCW